MGKRNCQMWLVGTILFVFMVISVNAQNLLTNPGAENGDTQGWVDPDNVWGAANDVTPHSGAYFFWPSRQAISYTEMYQDVDVSTYSGTIDIGAAWVNLTGWLRNWDQYPHDRATLAIEALDAQNHQLFYLSRDHRSPVWTLYQIEANIPIGTRKLRVHLIATRFVGSDNDGYFDDLSLEVFNIAPDVIVSVSSQNDVVQVPVDGTLQLSAQTTGAVDSGYVWSSSFDAVATVDDSGLVTAHKSGKFTVEAVGKNSGKQGYIELTAYNPDDIIFKVPETGAEWMAGTMQEIVWEVKGLVSVGTLYYSLTGGNDWIEIAQTDSVASGHFKWLVPDSTETFNNCYLKFSWDGGESASSRFSIISVITALDNLPSKQVPADYSLLSNYPNPFNPSTTIRYEIAKGNKTSQHVVLTVYDAFGKQIRELVNSYQGAGAYAYRFDPGDLATGVYFYRLSVGAFSNVRKMVYLR